MISAMTMKVWGSENASGQDIITYDEYRDTITEAYIVFIGVCHLKNMKFFLHQLLQ